MKKDGAFILVVLTLLFAAFLVGFLIGRNTTESDVVINSYVVPHDTSPIKADATPENTSPATEALHSATSQQININTATLEQLITLPGIGPALAQRILDFRETYGPFQNLVELTDIEGIGAKKIEAIKDLIILEDET